jgi:GTPase SAR1 family protein
MMTLSALACVLSVYRNTDSSLRKVRVPPWPHGGHVTDLLGVGKQAGNEWQIYDVGGSRSSRAAWAPFFDDVDAIIFLAPINVFDEKLLEDSRTNRLQDSYELWKQVMANKVLARTQIILFLNKYDLLVKKLNRGVKVRDYISSYGERENTPEVAVRCTYLQVTVSPMGR